MKKILTLALAFSMIQFAATAQVERANASKAKAKSSTVQKAKGIDDMEGLNLTAEQKNQIAVIQQDTRTKAAAIKASGLSEIEKKQQIKELRAANKTRMEAILTPSQKALLEARKTENKKVDVVDGKKQGKKHLNMDADKKAKMRAKYDNMSPETRARLKAIREDNTLTQEQKKVAVRKIMMENKENKAAAKTNKS